MERETKRLDVIANNLANASTNGFKTSGTTNGTFSQILEKVKVGKTNYYFNTKLIDLFLNHNSKEKTSVESIESVLDL